MKPDSPWTVLTLVVVATLGGTAGALLHPAAEPSTSATTDPALMQALADLTREVRALRDRPGVPRVATAEPVRTVDQPETGAELARLTAALEALLPLLRENVAGGVDAAVEATDPVALAAIPDPERAERLIEVRRLGEEDIRHAHFLWTYRQVMSRYGPPNVTQAMQDGSAIWRYDTSKGSFNFVFRDGMVDRFWDSG